MKTRLYILIFILSITNALSSAQGLLIPYRKGKLWGYADTNGKIIVAPRFDEVDNFFTQRHALVKENGKWGVVDQTGKLILETKYAWMQNMGEGKFLCHDERYNGLLMDSTGHIINKDTFNYAWSFKAGNAVVESNNGHQQGVVDENGKYVLPCKFEQIQICDNGIIKTRTFDQANKPGYFRFYKPDGEPLVKESFVEAICFKYGFANVRIKGNRVVKTFYLHSDRYGHDSLAEGPKVWNTAQYNILTERGEYISKENLEIKAPHLNYGMHVVRNDKKYGLMNPSGDLVLPLTYDLINGNYGDSCFTLVVGSSHDYYYNHTALVGTYIQSTHTLVKPQFNDIEEFSYGLAVVMLNNKYNYINKYGELILPEYRDYRLHEMYSRGSIIEIDSQEYWINRNGDIILKDIAKKYDDIMPFSENGQAQVHRNGKYFLVDTMGNEIEIRKEKKWESFDQVNNIYPLCGMCWYSKNGQRGVCDTSGSIQFQLQLKDIRYMGGKLFIYNRPEDFQQPGIWGVVDTEGNILLEPVYISYPVEYPGYLYLLNIGYISLDGKKFWE